FLLVIDEEGILVLESASSASIHYILSPGLHLDLHFLVTLLLLSALSSYEQDFESLGALGSGRTIPSWRMVVEAETAKLKKFQDFLRVEDKLVFHDLLGQCKLYAPYASTMASPVKEVP